MTEPTRDRGDTVDDATRSRPTIGVLIARMAHPGELLADARALENVGVGSIWADAEDGDPYVLLAAVAVVTSRVALVARGDPGGGGRPACEWLSRGRLVIAEERAEPWVELAFPPGRTAWRGSLAAAARSGAAGVLVRNDPRLLDLLRNPDGEDDRVDLHIAVG